MEELIGSDLEIPNVLFLGSMGARGNYIYSLLYTVPASPVPSPASPVPSPAFPVTPQWSPTPNPHINRKEYKMNMFAKVAFKLTHLVTHLNINALIPSLALLYKKVVLPHAALVALGFVAKKLRANRELGRRFVSKAKVSMLTLIPMLCEFLEFTLKKSATTG